MRSRTTKSLALSLLLVSMLSMPATAAVDRDNGPGRELPGFQRIVQVLRHLLNVAMDDTLSVPKP